MPLLGKAGLPLFIQLIQRIKTSPKGRWYTAGQIARIFYFFCATVRFVEYCLNMIIGGIC